MVLLLLTSACSRRHAPAAPRSAAADLGHTATLDGMGSSMLAPVRLEIMRPEALVARLALAPTAIVADIGAGPGAFTHALARAVPRGKVIATDVRSPYLERVERDARDRGERNIETRIVTPESSGLLPGEVDLAFLCQVDHYLRDRPAYLRALTATLRPGGRVVIVNYLKERDVIDALAKDLHWEEVDRWEPAMGFFGRIYMISRRPQAR